MSEIRWNSIFDGVSLALHAAFPDRQIHGGEVKQGLNPGDFNVVLPGGVQAQEVGRRYKRSPVVDVIYYPRTEDRAECLEVADVLAAVLEDITTPEGDLIHSTGYTWNADGGVLHVLLEYPHFVLAPQEAVKMETLNMNQRG